MLIAKGRLEEVPENQTLTAGTPKVIRFHLDLAFALSASRVLVTRDTDFLVLNSQGVEHAGLVYWTERHSLGFLIKELDSLCFDRTAEEMFGQVEYL